MQKKLQKRNYKSNKRPAVARFGERVYFDFSSPEGKKRFKDILLDEAQNGKATYIYELSLNLGYNSNYLHEVSSNYPDLRPTIEFAKECIGMRGLLGVRDSIYEKESIFKYLHKHLPFAAEVKKEEFDDTYKLRQAAHTNTDTIPCELVELPNGTKVKRIYVNDNITYEKEE